MKQIVIGLVGEPGSGKDTVCKYLKDKYGAKEIRFSDPLADALKNFIDVISRDDFQWLSHLIRERFGQGIFAKAMRKRISEDDKIIILNGVRFWENYYFAKSFPNNWIVYVTADQRLRWKRALSRMEKADDNSSFERFQELERYETEALIPEIGVKADFTIRNENDLNYMLAETDKIMEKIIK